MTKGILFLTICFLTISIESHAADAVIEVKARLVTPEQSCAEFGTNCEHVKTMSEWTPEELNEVEPSTGETRSTPGLTVIVDEEGTIDVYE